MVDQESEFDFEPFELIREELSTPEDDFEDHPEVEEYNLFVLKQFDHKTATMH